MTIVLGCKGGVMKKLLVTLLAIVAVFCTFAGCSENKADDGNNGGTNITGDTGNGENKGTNDNVGGDDKPQYEIVKPISNGGSFTGDDYK